MDIFNVTDRWVSKMGAKLRSEEIDEMNDTLLLLVIIFGIGVLIAVQGYNLLMQGQALLSPEARHKTGVDSFTQSWR
jgi:hypothetical protein